MKKILFGVIATLITLFPFVAFGAPATRVEVQPSAIYIYANNREDRSYNCSISFTWSHENLDGTRISQQVNTSAGVPPKFNGVLFSIVGAYVRVRIDSGPSINWN